MNCHPRSHALRGFHSSHGSGLHRLSLTAGHSGICAGYPFPARTPPSALLRRNGHGLNKAGYSGEAGISRIARPCTVHATFAAHGANKQILQAGDLERGDWRSPGRITRRKQKTWLWWVGSPLYRHRIYQQRGRPTPPGSGCHTLSVQLSIRVARAWIDKTPPSFDCLLLMSLTVVASGFISYIG